MTIPRLSRPSVGEQKSSNGGGLAAGMADARGQGPGGLMQGRGHAKMAELLRVSMAWAVQSAQGRRGLHRALTAHANSAERLSKYPLAHVG